MARYSIIKEKEDNARLIEAKIVKARNAFRKKDFKMSLDIYNSIEQKDMLNDLDREVIVFCERNCIRD